METICLMFEENTKCFGCLKPLAFSHNTRENFIMTSWGKMLICPDCKQQFTAVHLKEIIYPLNDVAYRWQLSIGKTKLWLLKNWKAKLILIPYNTHMFYFVKATPDELSNAGKNARSDIF